MGQDVDAGNVAIQRGDYATAVKEWRPLAEQGYADAQTLLGGMYAAGLGVPQDDTEAIRWFRMAAEQGYANAQYSLGRKYAVGRGVPQDFVQAYKWLDLAAAQGNERAKRIRDRTAELMTAEQIAEAQRLARE